MIVAQAAEGPERRWAHAYAALKVREPELIAAYECQLVKSMGSTTKCLSPELVEDIARSKLLDREAHQMVIDLGKKSIKVREQGEKVVKFILWSKDIISPAVSAEPYTALVWSGVSILLPVECTVF